MDILERHKKNMDIKGHTIADIVTAVDGGASLANAGKGSGEAGNDFLTMDS